MWLSGLGIVEDQKVTDGISGQGACLGCRAVREAVIDVSFSHQCFSLPLSSPLSKNKEIKSLKNVQISEKVSMEKVFLISYVLLHL